MSPRAQPAPDPDEKRWFRLTFDQHKSALLHTEEYEDAFQFRDWDTVSRLQDESFAAWRAGHLIVMPVAPDLPPSKLTTRRDWPSGMPKPPPFLADDENREEPDDH